MSKKRPTQGAWRTPSGTKATKSKKSYKNPASWSGLKIKQFGLTYYGTPGEPVIKKKIITLFSNNRTLLELSEKSTEILTKGTNRTIREVESWYVEAIRNARKFNLNHHRHTAITKKEKLDNTQLFDNKEDVTFSTSKSTVFTKFRKKSLIGKVAIWLLLFWLQMGVSMSANTAVFTNYVLPAKGYDTEIVIVNNDVRDSSHSYETKAIAYDSQGNELANEWVNLYPSNRLTLSLSDLFPGVNVDDIGLVKIKSSNKNDAWVIYSNGDQKAMVQAPIDGSSEVFNLHFTNNTGYWNFLNNIAKINDEESVVKAVVNPSGEQFYFDGLTNSYGFVMPNLSLGVSGASFNMKNFFGGVVPGDATWMKIVSEYSNQGVVIPVNNLINNTLFMKVNGESGGAFGNVEAFEELLVPHIAADGVYFWTGLSLNNPSDEFVKFVMQFYGSTGVHLDVDPSTSKIDDFKGVLPPYGKLVDLINNFGMPKGAAFARIVAEKPIMGGELFGGEPSGADWPIMAGVGLLLPGTGGYLYRVTDINTPALRYNIPLAESKAVTSSEEGIWTGIAVTNTSKRDQTIVLEYKAASGLIIGTQNYTVNSMSKQAITIEDLLKLGGLEDIREKVAMIDIVAKDNTAPITDNREVNVYALHGGKAVGSGTHSWMIGVDAVNKSPLDVKMFIRNDTVGIDGLEDMLGSMNIKVEDNDVILSHVIASLRDIKYGEITGYDIVALDDEWNEVGSLASVRRGLQLPENSNKPYYVNHSGTTPVQTGISPYGTFKLGVKVYSRINGVEQTWTYRIPDKTITRSPEQDYNIDALKGEGWSYERIKNDPEGFVDLLVEDGALYMGTIPITEANRGDLVSYFQGLTDGILEGGELSTNGGQTNKDLNTSSNMASTFVYKIKTPTGKLGTGELLRQEKIGDR